VNEFFKRNFSFETIHENNYRYTYDIATGLINLNYFEKAVWIEHPWLSVVSPDNPSFSVLVNKNWTSLQKCPPKRLLVDLHDLVQFHISPFVKDTAAYVKDLEFAPEQVKVFRPSSYGVKFCWCDDPKRATPFTAESLQKFVLNMSRLNSGDVQRRIAKKGTRFPW
jgi:hypothetical protein